MLCKSGGVDLKKQFFKGVIFFGGSEKRKDWACTIVQVNTIGM